MLVDEFNDIIEQFQAWDRQCFRVVLCQIGKGSFVSPFETRSQDLLGCQRAVLDFLGQEALKTSVTSDDPFILLERYAKGGK